MTKRQAERQMRRSIRHFTAARQEKNRAEMRETAVEERMREELLELDPSLTPACLSGMDGFDLARVYASEVERLDTGVVAFIEHLEVRVLPSCGSVAGVVF